MIRGQGELHPRSTVPFAFGKYGTKQNTEIELDRILAPLLHKKRLVELIQSLPGSPSGAVPPAATTISGKTLKEALANLKSIWPDCPECDDNFVGTRLNKLLGDLGMTSNTPFLGVADADGSILAFDVVPPDVGLDDAKNLTVGFDFGAAEPSANGRLKTGASVRQWMVDHFEGRFWNASVIQDHFKNIYQAIGLNPTVVVALAGKHPRSITISESSRIGRIIFPSDGNGNIDPNADRIAYLLLRTDQWPGFHAKDVQSTGDGTQFPLCLPAITGGKCTDDDDSLPTNEAQLTLDYLSSFWLAERTADLQALGYSVAAVSENSDGDPSKLRLAAIDLNVQKLLDTSQPADPAQAPTKPGNDQETQTTADLPSKREPAQVNPAARVPEVDKALTPKPADIVATSALGVDPLPKGTTPPISKNWLAEYGVAVQYRPNQGPRVLLQAQSRALTFSHVNLSATGQVGTDGTNPIGSGNVNADWLWFDKIHRRLEFQLTGSTDATARRILAGALTDERRTGGNTHAQLELLHDHRGLAWIVFAQPDHESVSLTRSGVAAGGGNLNTLTIGSGIVHDRWITNSPMRLTLNTQARVGTGVGAGKSAYAVGDVDGSLHRRVSNRYLISTDFAGRYQAASVSTPVFELPSLGGGESVRGFQTDDAMGRSAWSVQSELWAPVPGTLGAKEADGVLWFLRQNVRMAGFFDIGGVSDTSIANSPGLTVVGTSSASGLRRGTGAGIRFIQGLITLKFDWAYGFGQGAFGPGHGRVYLGVGTNGSF